MIMFMFVSNVLHRLLLYLKFGMLLLNACFDFRNQIMAFNSHAFADTQEIHQIHEELALDGGIFRLAGQIGHFQRIVYPVI